jgi:hypothetical protein
MLVHISAVYAENRGAYGWPRIWRQLRRQGIRVGTFRATVRLSKRYARLAAAGKDQRKIVTAVGRELLGFIWAIGVKAETRVDQQIAA